MVAKLRARRTRVINTIAVLLLDPSVNSDGVSIIDEIVIGLTRRLLPVGLFGLADFIAAASSVFVAFSFDRFAELVFQLG